MYDLTEVFANGIKSLKGYNHFNIIRKINTLKNIFCDIDDDGAYWDSVWENINNKSIIYAFISQLYPVALIKKDCPKSVIKIFMDSNVYIAKFEESFSCDEEILKKYAPYKKILDDRFLDDCNFSFDDERLFYIYDGIKYITPYNFTFDEIR